MVVSQKLLYPQCSREISLQLDEIAISNDEGAETLDSTTDISRGNTADYSQRRCEQRSLMKEAVRVYE